MPATSTTNTSIQKAISYLLSNANTATLADEYMDAACTVQLREVNLSYPLSFAIHALGIALKANFTKRFELSQLVENLIGEAEPTHHTFNYWKRKSNNSKLQALPDDVDDTAAAWAALHLASEEVPAEVFLNTIQLEADTGGPYRTWYVNKTPNTKEAWLDVDPAVNAHFLYLAGLNDIHLPQTAAYLASLLGKPAFKSVYYPTSLMTYYYLCKYISVGDEECKNLLVEETKRQLTQFSFDEVNELEQVLLVLCYLYLGTKVPDKWVDRLLSMQHSDGSIQTLALCHGFNTPNGELTYAGSKYAATALWLEALCLLPRNHPTKPRKQDVYTSNLVKQVHQALKSNTGRFTEVFSEKSLQKMTVLTVFSLAGQSLNLKSDHPILTQIAAAAVCGWKAYHILDDVLDNQALPSELIDYATLIRHSMEALQETPPQIRTYALSGFSATDEFYAWESKHARFKKFSKKIGHKNFNYEYIGQRLEVLIKSIGALALVSQKPHLVQDFETIFHIALFLQQMSDDAHDWEEDMRLGIRTYVLNHMALQKQKHDKMTYFQIFWQKTLPHILEICEAKYDAGISISQNLPNPIPAKRLLEKSWRPLLEAKTELYKTKKLISLLNLGDD